MTDKKYALEKAFQGTKDHKWIEYQDQVEDILFAASKIENFLLEEKDIPSKVTVSDLVNTLRYLTFISPGDLQFLSQYLNHSFDIRRKS